MPILCFISFIAMFGIATLYYLGWTPIEQNLEAKTLLLNLPFWQNVDDMERFCFSATVRGGKVQNLFYKNKTAVKPKNNNYACHHVCDNRVWINYNYLYLGQHISLLEGSQKSNVAKNFANAFSA